MLKLGSADPVALYVGDEPVVAVYVGDEQVWSASAFPTVDAIEVSGATSSSSESLSVTLPSAAAGKLIMVVATWDLEVTSPAISGFSLVSFDTDFGEGRVAILKKVAVGDEGGSASLTWDDGSDCMAFAVVISGASGDVEVAGEGGTNATWNPPSLTPSWGEAKTLWFCGYSRNNNDILVTAWPSGYDDNRTNPSISGVNCSLGLASREAEASSENPGSGTLDGNWWGRHFTIAVEPA